MLERFWDHIDGQIDRLRTARSADEVIKILDPPSSGDAFFAGSGGDDSVMDALTAAGWRLLWANAGYHWAAEAPDGSAITYVEGDVYRGNKP